MIKVIILVLILILSSCTNNMDTDTKTKTNTVSEKKMMNITRQPVQSHQELGNAQTTIKDRDKNRVDNIYLACSYISSLKLMPGEIFSFNNALGERTAQKGYKSAKVIMDKECAKALGGGICQVSSTLYMAAKSANLEIIERHKHSENVAYAPNGDDATIVYGSKDLKFKNNTNSTIYIAVWVNSNTIYAKITKYVLT